ncbi:hypothetical protein D3C86_2000600 [compost metagenome]
MTRLGAHKPFDEFTDSLGSSIPVAPLQIRNNSFKGNQRIFLLPKVILIPEADLLAARSMQ